MRPSQAAAAAAAQDAADATKALLAALDSRAIPTIRKAMQEYADKVEGVRLQSAAFELLSRVSKANDEELDKLIADMHLLATTRMETRMERRASMDLHRGSNASLQPPPPLPPTASLPPAPPMPPPRPAAPARKASLRGATHTNTADIRKELEQQRTKLRKVGARRRSLPSDLNSALLQGPAAVRAGLRHVEARERPSIHPGMQLHGAELRHVSGRASEEDVSEDDEYDEAAAEPEPPRMSRSRSSRSEVGVAGQAAAAPLLKRRSSSTAAAPLLMKQRSSSARAAAAQKGSSNGSQADEDMDMDMEEAPGAAAAPPLKKQRSSTLGLTGAMAGASLRTSKRGSSTDAVTLPLTLTPTLTLTLTPTRILPLPLPLTRRLARRASTWDGRPRLAHG